MFPEFKHFEKTFQCLQMGVGCDKGNARLGLGVDYQFYHTSTSNELNRQLRYRKRWIQDNQLPFVSIFREQYNMKYCC